MQFFHRKNPALLYTSGLNKDLFNGGASVYSQLQGVMPPPPLPRVGEGLLSHLILEVQPMT